MKKGRSGFGSALNTFGGEKFQMTYPCTFQSFCFEAVFMPEFINANNSKLDLKKENKNCFMGCSFKRGFAVYSNLKC